MKKLILLLLVFTLISCDEDSVLESLDDAISSSVTAKQSASSVLTKARTDYSSDAQLAGIYGWNVNMNGKVDLLSPSSSAFVYIVQSDIKQENEFYVPVYLAGPIKSPINFNTMLSFIKDDGAKEQLNGVFGLLAEQGIDPSANYLDSPAALNEVLSVSEASSFMAANASAKVDMILVPSKTIDIFNGIVNSADWIVHLYTNNESKVFWLNSGTRIVTKL